jgi:hypothetical protein
MSSKNRMLHAQGIATRAGKRSADPSRHNCFVSYHVADLAEVETFLEDFGDEIIARTIGVTEEDDFIDSTDEDFVRRRIREDYLADTTVTIVLLGRCTWARKYVDWEISSSLRNDPVNRRSGLLVIPLISMNNSARLPARIKDNWTSGGNESSYASYVPYPSSGARLRDEVEIAYDARTGKANLVDNSRSLMASNRSCDEE